MSPEQVTEAVDRMQRAAGAIEEERARLSSALWGVYQIAGYRGVLVLVASELRRMAQRLPPREAEGWDR